MKKFCKTKENFNKVSEGISMDTNLLTIIVLFLNIFWHYSDSITVYHLDTYFSFCSDVSLFVHTGSNVLFWLIMVAT